ncbi:DUF4178 domain-containing protein [uncultured Massilia sp.]|uniref:DUF4178 domain-containing protein n=1 Tax=uncultured Massilia sp. TaxID=169973 RepID=UPI0025D02F3E|nr:DUF4178 domain-containing protein [uncultured Massilia sp.]
MQTVSCPGCGAPLEFKSHASVMAVCDFCRTVVVKDADAVRDLGKMAAVLEDYSPIQIGTSGRYGERAFTVVGRIQLRWSGGIWNEWYLLFGDGGNGWLGDSAGRYVITLQRALEVGWPVFEAIQPGREMETGAGRYIAAERRSARCIAGQGELPFRVGAGWEARVADFRRGSDFVTLDYSDGDRPALYAGAAVTLEQMGCQLLRDDEAIKASAGKYRGRVESLSCPQCGTAIAYLPGITASLVCQACRAQLDAATPVVQVLAKGEEAGRTPLTLPLGSTGQVNGRETRVLGALVRADDEGNRWTEYLLHGGGRAGFSWLIESDGEWWRAEGMDEWPAEAGAVAVRHDRVAFTKLYDYPARTEQVLGAFYWKAQAGDTVRVAEYQHGPVRLSSELSDEEFTWSRSSRVAYDQVRLWFKLPAAQGGATGAGAPARVTRTGRFLLWLVLLNLVPLVLHFSGAAPWVLVGLLALALPPSFIGKDRQ